MQEFISPIAVDLGAIKTGAYFIHYLAGEDPVDHIDKALGCVIQYSSNLTISQAGRRQSRHQTRGYKRRKMAKRLFYAFLKSRKVDFYSLEPKLRDFLNGLFNRRGFTYFTEGLDEELIESLDPHLINELIGRDVFDPEQNILRQVSLWADSPPATAQKFMVSRYFHLQPELPAKVNQKEKNAAIKKAKQKEIKGLIEEADSQKNVYSAIENLHSYAHSLTKEDGHKPRRKYFANIKDDIQNFNKGSKEFASLLKKIGLSADQLANFIGHSSNLQLRVLRKYFNDKAMQKGDAFDKKRLARFFKHWLHALRPNSETQKEIYENHKKLLGLLKQKQDKILDIFLNQNPDLSLPPYEDQNNRRPPLCQSLLFDLDLLRRELSQWEKITDTMIAKDSNRVNIKEIDENMPKYIGTVERKALLFQRFLDRTAAIDPYQIRALANPYKNPLNTKRARELQTASQQLEDALGKKEMQALLELAKKYYEEKREARLGTWSQEDYISNGASYGKNNRLLKLCNRKPKLKKNCQKETIGSILGIRFRDEQEFEDFQKFWHGKEKTIDRSTVRGVCKNLEKKRKEHGNGFAEFIKDTKAKAKSGSEPNLDKDEKALLELLEKGKKASEAIAAHLKLNGSHSERFDNPFSLAQIYNIMEGEIHGFYSTCMRCTLENGWRTLPSVQNSDRANASRLSAKTIRPFNGTVRRLMEAKAAYLARQKIEHLMQMKLPASAQVCIPAIIEQNKFAFTADMAAINMAKTKDKAKKRADKYQSRLLDKDKRIKEASKSLCPYTGKSIIVGEIDHIIPRSQTRKLLGTVFNSEANLIYASQTGNTQKANRIYYLDSLHKNYLQKQFETSDINAIEKKIETGLKQILEGIRKSRGVFEFSHLSEEEQRYVRHALFVHNSELRNKAIGLLNTAYKARVNGTQAYFVEHLHRELGKRIQTKFKTKNIKWRLEKIPVDSEGISIYRGKLDNTLYAKKEPQSDGSHVVDACLAFAHALSDAKNLEILKAPPPSENGNAPSTIEWLQKLQAKSLHLHELGRRPKYRKSDWAFGSQSIFKDGIYGERFLPLLIYKGCLCLGFEAKNCVEVNKNEEEKCFGLLQPYLIENGKALADDLNTLKARKKFLHFSIHKKKAIELLHKAAKENLDQQSQEQADLLEGLRYTVQKKNVMSILLTDKEKKIISNEDIENFFSKNFKIKAKIQVPGSSRKAVKGTLIYPEKSSWERFFSVFKKKKLLGKKLNSDKKENFLKEADRIIRDFFPNTNPSTKKHHKVRKVFSLCVVTVPSGGIRLRRRQPGPDGERLYQLVAVDGNSTVGFPLDKKEHVDLNQESSVILPQLAKSKNVSFVEKTEPVPLYSSKQICYYDEWRQVDVSEKARNYDIRRLWLAPGSQDRMDMCIELSLNSFVKNVYSHRKSDSDTAPEKTQAGKKNSPIDPALIYALHGNLKLEENPELFEKLSVKPRGLKLTLKSIDKESVKIKAKVGSNDSLRELYQKGTAVAVPF